MRIPRTQEDWAALGYIAGWRFVGLLPHRLVRWAADRAADRFSDGGRGPAQLRRNLARVVGCPPEEVPDALVRASMRSYLRYWVEAFRLPSMVGPELVEAAGAHFDGLGIFEEARASGRGIVMALTHSGNWDMAGMWLVDRIGGFTTVAERLRPEELYDAFVDFREGLGFTVLPLTGGEPPMEGLRARLRDGGVVCLLGERDLGGRGVEVDFFGERTTMPAGAAQLARETGAALHVVHVHFVGDDGWGMKMGPEIPVEGRDIADIVQEQARHMEADIAAHPADWHMLQPLWLADRRRRRAETAEEQAADRADAAGATEPTGRSDEPAGTAEAGE
ncbi:phosphatidylinositol mannoside acyltransferase [Corynebacterium sp. 335C]